jgi:hypothetical protein
MRKEIVMTDVDKSLEGLISILVAVWGNYV